MKPSKILQERIRRVVILFRELGYEITETENLEEMYFTAAFIDEEAHFQGGFLIDRDSRFLEISFAFSFSLKLYDFIQSRLKDMMSICFEFGCYSNLENNGEELNFGIFSKIYYTGLNYNSLKETLKDFKKCLLELKKIVSLEQPGRTENDEST